MIDNIDENRTTKCNGCHKKEKIIPPFNQCLSCTRYIFERSIDFARTGLYSIVIMPNTTKPSGSVNLSRIF